MVDEPERSEEEGGERTDLTGARLAALIVAIAVIAGVAGGLIDRAFVSRATSPTPTISRASLQMSGGGGDLASIVEKMENAIVAVGADSGQGFGATATLGTGVVLTADGEVVTASHIVHGASAITVTIDGQTHGAQLLGEDTGADVALLRVQAVSGLRPAQLGDASLVQVGDDVIAIGHALGLAGAPTVTRGIVSGTNRSFDLGNGVLSGLIQTDAGVSSGDSGGALVNADGKVIGMLIGVASSGRTFAAADVGFAVSINDVTRVVNAIRGF